VKEILVVEDDKVGLKIIHKILDNKQVNITDATNGKTALDLLRARKFDCIILDLTLPDISGFEVLKQLKADKDIPNVPVVVYTGKELTAKEVDELHEYTD